MAVLEGEGTIGNMAFRQYGEPRRAPASAAGRPPRCRRWRASDVSSAALPLLQPPKAARRLADSTNALRARSPCSSASPTCGARFRRLRVVAKNAGIVPPRRSHLAALFPLEELQLLPPPNARAYALRQQTRKFVDGRRYKAPSTNSAAHRARAVVAARQQTGCGAQRSTTTRRGYASTIADLFDAGGGNGEGKVADARERAAALMVQSQTVAAKAAEATAAAERAAEASATAASATAAATTAAAGSSIEAALESAVATPSKPRLWAAGTSPMSPEARVCARDGAELAAAEASAATRSSSAARSGCGTRPEDKRRRRRRWNGDGGGRGEGCQPRAAKLLRALQRTCGRCRAASIRSTAGRASTASTCLCSAAAASDGGRASRRARGVRLPGRWCLPGSRRGAHPRARRAEPRAAPRHGAHARTCCAVPRRRLRGRFRLRTRGRCSLWWRSRRLRWRRRRLRSATSVLGLARSC